MIEEHLRSKEDRSNIPNPLEQWRKTRSTFPSEEILCSSPVPLVVSSTRSSTVDRNICSFERCPNIASNFCSPLFARFARLFEQSQRIRKTACSFSRRREKIYGRCPRRLERSLREHLFRTRIRETGRIYDDVRHFSVRGHTVESASPRDPGEMSERRCFRLSQKLRRSHARPVINTV